MKKTEMIEKFGKEIENLKGFIERLDIENFKRITFTSGHTGEVIYAKVYGAIGLFIAEESQWGSRGGLGKKMVVGVYRNGKTVKKEFQFIDQYDARGDNKKIKFEKLDIDSVYYDRVYLKAYTENGDNSILCFKITGNEN